MASAAVLEGPTHDRLARARCLVPVLGHVAVRLASLGPALRLVGEVMQGRVAAGDEHGGSTGRSQVPEQVRAAADEVLTRSQEVARFAADLAELCGAEGQWLAVLALAPKVVRRFRCDFEQLSGSLEALVQLLPDPAESAHSGEAQVQAATLGGVGAQPGAVTCPEQLQDPLGSGATRGLAAVLRALLAPAVADLQGDLISEHLSSRLTPMELEIAPDLLRRLLPHAEPEAEHKDGDAQSCASTSAEAGGREALLARLSQLGGTPRPLAVLARELEAAEQYCRVLDGTASGAETRQSCNGRDALVSEAQASGGSALHRWLRTEVSEPHFGTAGGSPPAAAGGRSGGDPRPSFVKLSEIPHEFLCPIAQDVMRDAVSTCDGHTYERRNIEAWLAEKSTSPNTGLPLANKTLIPNHNLRKLILDSGVLSRLEPDAKPESEGTHFREEVCCEIVVPRDAATLAEALLLGSARVAASSPGGPLSSPLPSSSGLSRGTGRRLPVFGVRLLAGDHAVQQTIHIDQEVEIIGAGTSGTVLRLAAETTLEVRSGCRLANIAICRDAAATLAADVAFAAAASARGPRQGLPVPHGRSSGARSVPLLEITQGSCRVEQCDLSNSAGSAIRVSGAHTSPVISRNTIHGCRDTGVVFKDSADGALMGNRLFGNCCVAIEVHSQADPLIEDNDVFDGRQGGVFVYNRGRGHLRRNKIFRNALEGVEIKQGGRPLVEDNDIYDNLECGIFIHEGGEGRIIGNRIHSNSYAGIEIKDASSPEVRGNDVYSGRTSGMYIHSGGQGVIEGNSIHQNWLHGVYVRSKGFPHLMKNQIFKNDECGIFVTESSNPIVEHNEVYSNGLAGIEVKEESNPTIKLNRIHDGNTGGIFVLSHGRGKISENKLYSNKLEGIEIKDGGDPHVIDNEIYDNLECGVFAHDGALGRIEDNRIFGNAYAGIEIKDMSSPIVVNNRVYRGQTSGIYVHSGGQGKLSENEVFENGLHGVMILSGGNPWMARNKIHDNVECGVVAHVAYVLDTSCNQIYNNRIKNVQSVKS